MDTLAKLFSSKTLVKVMRLFLFNPHEQYVVEQIVERTRAERKKVTYELKLLTDIGFLKQLSATQTKKTKAGTTKKKVKAYVLDTKFIYLAPLKVLLVNTDLMNRGELEKRLSAVGKLTLVIAGGVFMQEPEHRIDLLIVGEKIKQAALMRVIKDIEAAIGTELRYAVLSPEEFEYRASVRDRLIRDVFEHQHFIVKNSVRYLNLGDLVA